MCCQKSKYYKIFQSSKVIENKAIRSIDGKSQDTNFYLEILKIRFFFFEDFFLSWLMVESYKCLAQIIGDTCKIQVIYPVKL